MPTDIRERATTMARIDTHCHFRGQPRVPDVCPVQIHERVETCPDEGLAEAFLYMVDRANISLQLVFTTWDPQANRLLNQLRPRVAFLAYADELIGGYDTGAARIATADELADNFCYYESLCERLGTLDTIDDYLHGIDRLVDGWRAKHVVGVKTAQAYTFGLSISDPSYEDARTAFSAREGMSADDKKIVRDFAFRHVILACKRNDFPLLIHTGEPAWGGAILSQTNPMLLHNILTDERYKEVTFVLLHGGLPSYSGETTFLGRICPNVIIDLTGVPTNYRARFGMVFAEWLCKIPHERFCLGSDSTRLGSIGNTDRMARKNIANALEHMVADGMIDEKKALAFIEHAYVNTAKRVFNL